MMKSTRGSHKEDKKMKREEVRSVLQFAIRQLTVALTNISQIDENIEHTENGLTLSLAAEAEQRIHEIVVFEDQALSFTPNQTSTTQLRPNIINGRPTELPLRTCPRCQGKGRV